MGPNGYRDRGGALNKLLTLDTIYSVEMKLTRKNS